MSLTHRQQPPHDGGRGEAGEDVVGVGEVCEVGHDDGLTPTLTPHVHLGINTVTSTPIVKPVFVSKPFPRSRSTPQSTGASDIYHEEPFDLCTYMQLKILSGLSGGSTMNQNWTITKLVPKKNDEHDNTNHC